MRPADSWKDYELLDATGGNRLERWGETILIRPDPQVVWKTEKQSPLWAKADAIYHRSNQGGGEWEYRRRLPEKWKISCGEGEDKLTLIVSPTGFKHTGVFPEQAVNWAWYARMVRNLVVSLRQREFILAARLSGASQWRLFSDHLAGAVIPSLLVLATLDIGHMMLHVAGMSFLGLGVTAPTAEWGVMINDARQYIWTQPLQMFWPGLALFISVMAFNLVGDALRDHLDPHLVTEHAH